MPINPISATLLHTGKVLIVAGSENDASNNSHGAESYRNAIWDPTGTAQSSITVQQINYDVFCSGTAVLPDGRPLVVGGTSDYSFKGDNRASIFDPARTQFVQTQNMAGGRWYATATALGDGRVMAFSGKSLGGGTNNTVEIYDLRNAGAGWTSPVTAPFTPPLYPRMFLLPDGNVFYTGHGATGNSGFSWIFDPVGGIWIQSAATTPLDRSYGSAVLLPLLPPSYTPKVMNFGGGSPATPSTEIIDLSTPSPSWNPGPDMSTGRVEMNAIILPNGRVLAEGGSLHNQTPDKAGKRADLYDPVTQSFSSGGTASYSRLYHSTALLLPDATVVSMGSNPGTRGKYEPAIEIYTPPYLFDASDHLITTNRPRITGITPGVIGYNATFYVTYTGTSAISSAVLVRPGSTSHASDMDQRLIGLCGPTPQPPCTGSGTLTLTTPPNGNIAPPGYYMLFLLDSAGVPSTAQFIQLSPYTTSPPSGTLSTPASDTTIQAGGSVSFGTTSTAASYSWVFPNGSPATSTAQNPGNGTFSTPGSYVASLTVIDASGNSDPSPPTRTITVLPMSPDFAIAVSPSSSAVFPGQQATFTATVTPLSGFNGAVSLSVGSENGFPSGITSGGFNPPSIAGSGSSALSMNTTTSAAPYALSLTITGTAGSITHTASTTLLVSLAAPTSLTATSGSAGQITLSWTGSSAATSYHVKRALVSGGPYEGVACTTTTTTSYTDTGLISGTTYYYVVSAAYSAGPNAGGESVDSSEASAVSLGADLFLRVQASPTPIHQGALLTYAFPVWNLGPSNAVHEVLNTQVPAGTTFDYIRISGTPGLGTCTNPPYQGTGQIVCHENSSMAPNTSWTISLTVQVTAPSGSVITESATATEDTFDPNLANNTAKVSNTVQ
jgi:PKD repeat protein